MDHHRGGRHPEGGEQVTVRARLIALHDLLPNPEERALLLPDLLRLWLGPIEGQLDI